MVLRSRHPSLAALDARRLAGAASSRTGSVVSTRSLSEPLGLRVLPLLLDAPSLGASARPGGPSRFLRSERRTDAPRKALLGNLSVAELRTFVIDDDSKYRTKVFDQRFTLRGRDRLGVFDAPGEFDPSRGLVGMLPTRTSGRAETFGELGIGDDE